LAWVHKITLSLSGSPLATPYVNWATSSVLTPPQADKTAPAETTAETEPIRMMKSRRFWGKLIMKNLLDAGNLTNESDSVVNWIHNFQIKRKF
jgi:hypothetical protein